MHHPIYRNNALFVFLVTLAWVSAASAKQPDSSLLSPGARVVFLGDSITSAGEFIAQIDACLQTATAENPPELINLGLGSETCCGLSEPPHPFPRPDVHERLARVLEKTKPDVVFACYGMNDGIYYPFDADRFAKYQAGLKKLIAACKQAGARVVLVTPPPFDPQLLAKKGKLRPTTAEVFSWMTPSEDYDQVIKRYADWVLTLRSEVDDVIDVHTPITKYVDAKRKTDPAFALSHDGVHLNAEGHSVLAEAILAHLGVKRPTIAPKVLELYQRRLAVMHAAWLSEVGHLRPNIEPGLPLAEARATAAKLTVEIKQVASATAAE